MQRERLQRSLAARESQVPPQPLSNESGVAQTANVPNVKYAQRKDSIYLTIELPDVTDETIEVKPVALCVTGTSGGLEYALDVQLFKPVNTQKSIFKVFPRSIHILLKKAEEETWPRILKERAFEKKHFKSDWDRWKDEDDVDAGEFDTSALGAGSDMGGPPGGGAGGPAEESLAFGHADEEDEPAKDWKVPLPAPNVKWVQRQDAIFLTVLLPDVTNATIDIRVDSLCVKGTSGGKEYAMDVKLFRNVDPERSNFKIYPLAILIFLQKVSLNIGYWRNVETDGNECILKKEAHERNFFKKGSWTTEEEWREEGEASARSEAEQLELDTARREEMERAAARTAAGHLAKKEELRLEKRQVGSSRTF